MTVYGVKSKSDILVSILDSLQKNSDITAIYPGSIARAFAEAFSEEISDLYESFRFTVSQSDLSTATGRNLDLIGDLYGIRRKSISDQAASERRSFNMEFYLLNPHSSDVVVPAGTKVYNDVTNFATKQYAYELQSAVTIAAGAKKAYGRVEPTFYDDSYVAPVGSLTKHSFSPPASVTVFCTNAKEVYSVINAESDNNYRRRIMASMKTRTAGTAESIRFAALSVKGVKDVRVRESSYGIGSCDVIIVPEVGSTIKRLPESIIQAVNSVKPVGIRMNVSIAEKIPVDVRITVTIASGNSQAVINGINNQASLFVKRYLNTLSIGDPLSISEIERQAKRASDAIKSVTINRISYNGQDVPLQDFTPKGVREYFTAGSVNVFSVIIGNTNY